MGIRGYGRGKEMNFPTKMEKPGIKDKVDLILQSIKDIKAILEVTDAYYEHERQKAKEREGRPS